MEYDFYRRIFMDFYSEIKNELVNNEINRKVKSYSVNRSDLNTYYNVGKMLSEAGKHYGEGIIKEYSARLTGELGKGYTFTALTRMKNFYFLLEKLATVSQHLSYGHYVELVPYHDINKVKYYIKIVEEENLSIRKLRERIKSNEYERLPESVKNKFSNNTKFGVSDFVKNPILIKNNGSDVFSEKILQRMIIEDIPSFLDELGSGFTFVKNEYPIKLGDRYNYIDLLLFNVEYNCYVVVELKVTELKKEHIGQIQVYMNYIDENVKKIYHEKSVGIVICKQDSKYVIKYCSDNRIISRTYELV